MFYNVLYILIELKENTMIRLSQHCSCLVGGNYHMTRTISFNSYFKLILFEAGKTLGKDNLSCKFHFLFTQFLQ